MILMAEESILTMKLMPPEILNPACEEHPLPTELPEKPGRDILKSHMEEMERQIISRCLEECGGNVTRAAEQLGSSRKGLQLKMIKHHLRSRMNSDQGMTGYCGCLPSRTSRTPWATMVAML